MDFALASAFGNDTTLLLHMLNKKVCMHQNRIHVRTFNLLQTGSLSP